MKTFILILAAILMFTVVACEPGPIDPPTTTEPFETTTTQPVTSEFAGMNILWVQSDDQTCNQIGVSMCDSIQAFMPWLRSNVDEFVNFPQARTHNSVCCPNRGTNLTGQTSFHNGIISNSECKNFSEVGILPRALQQAGYKTAITGKYLNCFRYPSTKWPAGSPPQGWDYARIHNGLPSYSEFDIVRQDGGTETVTGTWEPYWMRDRGIEFINSVNAENPDQPWFLYYTPYAPHAPSTSPPGYQSSFSSPIPKTPDWREGCPPPGNTTNPITDKPSFIQDNGCTGNLEAGKGALWGLDNAFRDLYQLLEATGELENTIILFTSDNGMGFGSHRVNGKTCAYERCHAIPFLLRIPGIPGGVVDRMVSNLDIYSTFAQFAGAPILRSQDGMSILPLVLGTATSWRDDQFLWNKQEGYRALREDCRAPGNIAPDPCYQLTEYTDGQTEFYDLNADPWQLDQLLPNSLTGYPGQPGWTLTHPDVVDMRSRLQAAYTAGGGTVWP